MHAVQNLIYRSLRIDSSQITKKCVFMSCFLYKVLFMFVNQHLLSMLVKVFRLNGRPYCYSSVSFSLLLLRSSVSNGRPYCFLRIILFFSYSFSQKPGWIFMKFSGLVYIGLAWPKKNFRVMTSLPV